MNVLNEVAYWTVLLIWGLGALCAVLLLFSGVQYLSWHLYKEAIGWPVIFKAMREHRERQMRQEGDQ